MSGLPWSGVRLAAGVGRYRLAVRARHRTEIARLYDGLLDRFRDGFNTEFQAALRELQPPAPPRAISGLPI